MSWSALWPLTFVSFILGEDVFGGSRVLIHDDVLLSENWASHFEVEFVSRVTSDAACLFIDEILDGGPKDSLARRIW